jgi:predicted N-acyltransferase
MGVEFNSKGHIFSKMNGFELFENSGAVGDETGWKPCHFEINSLESNKKSLPAYIKHHSWGEYIFDWQWAEAYQRLGFEYYPKLIHAVPFSPISSKKFLNTDEWDEELFDQAYNFYLEQTYLSGHHFLFMQKMPMDLVLRFNYQEQLSVQFHFFNQYSNFDDFLNRIKKSKRKQIRKERKRVLEYGLNIEFKAAKDCSELEIARVFELYLTTIDKKQSYAYLNQSFFKRLFSEFKENVRVALAKQGENVLAMSLFLVSDQRLYGRYWGIDPTVAEDFKFLHFELCYYQGMEFCMRQKLEVFEAGAQGGHKLLRGFQAVPIYSYHHLRHHQIFPLIKQHLVEQNRTIVHEIHRLNQLSPLGNDLLIDFKI